MAKVKKRTKIENSKVFDDRVNEILLGNVTKLNSKNKKLLKLFKVKAEYIYLFYCLNVTSKEYEKWETDLIYDSLDDRFNRLVYLLNKNLDECIEDLNTSMMNNIGEIDIPKDIDEIKKPKKLESYKDLAKKVGL